MPKMFQVARMLPEGLEVIGLYAVDDKITADSDAEIREFFDGRVLF